ncbi:hypothetical protein WJX72_010945 [[Myrmecia] bisecta]|uniref:Uncharacterized protein n=1 Tax=[Myrmecia] bisecta TaxID=41462 RepID=A0AAW1Q1R8_9CHLO
MPDQGFKNYLPADLPRKYHPTEVLPSQRKSSGGSKSLLPVKLTVTARVSFRIVYNRGHEMDEPSQDILEGQFADVKVVDAAYLNYPKHHQLVNVEHHVIKAYAFYHCPFDQVLVLDADNLPLMDPTPLFNSDGFKEHGSMFWPGFDHDVPRKAYQLFRLQPPRGPGSEEIKSTEAGQFLFDRRMHADVVEWVWFLNAYGPDGVYKYTQTDTDTYQLAFSLAGKAAHFHQVDQRPRAMLCHIKPEHQDDKRFMHTGVLHHTPDGQPLFAHRLGEGKLSPLADWECMGMHYVSVPLNPERAALLYAPNRYLRSYADEDTMRGVIRKAARTYDSIRDPIRRGDMFGHVCSSYTMQNGVECPNVEMLAAVRRRNH